MPPISAREIVAKLTPAQRQMLPTITVKKFPPLGYAVLWTVGRRATYRRLEAKGLVDHNGLTPLGREVASLLEGE